jgi:membrane associated rhomboid family serine protease
MEKKPKQAGLPLLDESLIIAFSITAVITMIHILSDYGYMSTRGWGIYPREIWGALGILLSPLVHGSYQHLVSNAGPLTVTIFTLLYFYRKIATRSIIMVWFFTGILVWLLAGRAWHIGASGVVYGLVSLLFFNGVFRKNRKSMGLAAIMLVLYSGMLSGIFPNEPNVSWESHMGGFLVGIFVAWWFKAEVEEDELIAEPKIVFEDSPKTLFLPPDTFEKTKAERIAEQEELQRQSLLDQGFPPYTSDWT